VLDESGGGLSGISVLVKGTANGVTTDRTGNFQISAPSGSTLVFSGVGYESKEVSPGDQASLTVSLSTESRLMSEIVVTGTGVATERRKLSIDVASVSNKDLSKTALLSIDNLRRTRLQSHHYPPGNQLPGKHRPYYPG
jgi:hypothetical protein